MPDQIFLLDVLKYLALILGVWWFLWVLLKRRITRPRAKKRVVRRVRSVRDDPYFSPSRASHSGAFDLLVNALAGDMRAANRLVQYELSRAPGISHSEAITRAMERLARDKS
jgi:hypothetical protein